MLRIELYFPREFNFVNQISTYVLLHYDTESREFYSNFRRI